MSAVRRAAPRMPTPVVTSSELGSRATVTPFRGKGDGGMAQYFPAGERLRSPSLGEGAGEKVVE